MSTASPFTLTPDITVATQVIQSSALQAQLWARNSIVAEENSDFYQGLEGEGDEALIRSKTDTSKGDGSYVNFRLMAGFYYPPHFGGQYFNATIDYEALKQGVFGVQVRRVIHGASIDSEVDEFLGMNDELARGIPKMQGEWMGRLKAEQIEMVMRTQLPSTNIYTINGGTIDSLNSSTGLSYNFLVGLKETAATQGGRPARMKMDKSGNEILGYTLISPQQGLYSLELDNNFIGALKVTRDPEAAATYFDGGWENARGVIIRDRRVIDHDGWGPIASPLNPKAFLGNAISSSSTAITVLGGGDAVSAAQPVDYFRYFINNPYQFQSSSTPGATYFTVPQDALTHYFLIVNPPNSPAGYVSGGIGMYAYTTQFNNTANGVAGYSITTTQQLGPVNNGYQSTTVGTVQWNQGVWATALNGGNIQTTSHPVGAMIYQCNAKGQTIGFSEFLARGGIYRGYGSERLKRSITMLQGDMVKQIFMRSTFGQVPRPDTRGRTPAAFGVWHSILYPNTSIPVNIV
jgi:hypothetical protein